MSKIVVEVCSGTHCVLMGSMDIMDAIASLAEVYTEQGKICEIEINAIPCLNNCKQGKSGPVVIVDGQEIEAADSESIMAMIMEISKQKGCS